MKTKPNIVLYDDQCPLCTFQVRVITWLDWFNAVVFMPMSDPRAAKIAPTLTPADLQAAMHSVTSDGRLFRGARSFRHLGMRVPLLFPIALALWIPGVIRIAEWIYDRVSRNRYVLSRVFRCKEACAILPERKPRGNETEALSGGKL